GVLRPRICMSKPTAVGSPSDQPSDGLWQVAQLIDALRDRRRSKNSIWPSFTRAALGMLSAGAGAVAGRSHGSLSDAHTTAQASAKKPRINSCGSENRSEDDLPGMRRTP